MLDQDMNEYDDINYEDLDDLPLLDHIEWNHLIEEKKTAHDPSQYWLDD